MKAFLFHRLSVLLLLFSLTAHGQDSIVLPEKNQQVLDTAMLYGRTISPTYESAVCTEFVIGVLEHFMKLSKEDKVNIRIDQPRESLNTVYQWMEDGSPQPKGVYNALISNGKGEAIDDITKVLPGDFVQFWYPSSWGHCGIVSSMDLEKGVMYLHSSYPSTDGYGIQPFVIPDYCFFVRLKP